MKIYVFMSIFLITAKNVRSEDVIISNEKITKSIVHSLADEIDTRKKNNYTKLNNHWRYENKENITNSKSNDSKNLNLNIPLIWYHERF